MEWLYVVGGRQRPEAAGLEEWHRFEAAVIACVHPESGEVRIVEEYVSPPEACPDEQPSFVFKAGHLEGTRLFVSTQTEVLVYELPSMQRVGYVSLPCFNDVHHARPLANGNIAVVSTGLDAVFEVTPRGRVVREWGAMGADPFDRFSRDVDYRKVSTTKPHASHPNFVFELEGEPWVTRFEQRDAIRLDCATDRMAIDVERPHDGVVCEDEVVFTTVDGHVVRFDARSRARTACHDLNAIGPGDKLLGWCRSVAPIGPDRFAVGFTRIRRTRFRENLGWARRRLGQLVRGESGGASSSGPSRVAAYDFGGPGELLWECCVEDAGMNVIFSIHPVDAMRVAARRS